MNSFPQVDQFIRIQIYFYFLCVSYWSIDSETKSHLKVTGSWSIFYQMNWSGWGKELVQYFINTSIASTVILCLCKQIYAICTPRTEFVHRTCRQWSSFSIVRTQNKSLHREIYAIYFWCIVFQIVFQVFQSFVCPEGNLDS
jgi:hypothetical protein